MKRGIGKAWLLFVAWCASAVAARAHEPLDFSTRVVLHADRVEVTATLGVDGVRALLSHVGYSRYKIAETLRARGSNDFVAHPAALARMLFRVESGGRPLESEQVRSLSEGIEIVFTLVLPRAQPGEFAVRATAYETIPGLRPGSLLVSEAATGADLGGMVLTAGDARWTITLRK